MEIEARKTIYIPLNFLRTGDYRRSDGYINVRIADGYWWSAAAGSNIYSIYLDTHPAVVNPQHNYYRGYGFAVRCVVREEWREE